jgi:cation diffusion facilitator family transporter
MVLFELQIYKNSFYEVKECKFNKFVVLINNHRTKSSGYKLQPKLKIILSSLLVSILLMLMKFGAYFITHSNAILTDAAESIVNVLASAFAFYSIYLASQPKDQNHPYGHGKVEFFSAFIEGVLILLAGLLIVAKSVYNIFYPQQLEAILDGVAIIAITGIANGFLGLYLLKKGKSLRSITLSADGKHLITDAISTFGLMLGLVVIYFTGIFILDSLISIGLGFYIIYSGYRLVRKSVAGLMDEVDVEVVSDVVNFLNLNRKDAWIDVHNLRAQRYGAETHIDCHVTLPYYYDLNEVHYQISEIDRLVGQNIGDKTEFFIHADPCIPRCCHYCNVKNCPVRYEPQTKNIIWTLDNITKNQKHFEE